MKTVVFAVCALSLALVGGCKEEAKSEGPAGPPKKAKPAEVKAEEAPAEGQPAEVKAEVPVEGQPAGVKAEAPAEGQPVEAKAEEQKPVEGTPEAPAAPALVVPEEGQKYDPPVQVAQLPEGAWYCDMGTVHYARMQEGDGKCPICKMALKKRGAEAPAGAHDHDHGDHGHAH